MNIYPTFIIHVFRGGLAPQILVGFFFNDGSPKKKVAGKKMLKKKEEI
jgi:hypothetical protein